MSLLYKYLHTVENRFPFSSNLFFYKFLHLATNKASLPKGCELIVELTKQYMVLVVSNGCKDSLIRNAAQSFGLCSIFTSSFSSNFPSTLF